jgi:hypothetical protein
MEVWCGDIQGQVSWSLGNYQIKISKQVCGIGELKCEYINMGSESVKKYQLKREWGLCEPMHHKAWFDSQMLDQLKHVKMHLLQKFK